MNDLKEILKDYRSGILSEEEVLKILKKKPFIEMGYAKPDTHRKLLQGNAEIIYGAGKTPEQIGGIAEVLLKNGQEHILITILSEEKSQYLQKNSLLNESYEYFPEARLAMIGGRQEKKAGGYIAVITAGTSDMPVAEEAALTAEFLGNDVRRIYDAGVAGLHRLLSHLDDIMDASVIIAIAGMEGALASVVGGLAECPVIAVPTSVGYGASFGGLSALLSMLNSCASGVSVVNIDNGFGAAYQASMINHK